VNQSSRLQDRPADADIQHMRNPVKLARAAVAMRTTKASLSGSLAHIITVPHGPDGRPGAQMYAFSRSGHPPRMTADNAREDFTCLLSSNASALKSVCLGRVGERGDPLTNAAETLELLGSRPGMDCVEATEATMCGVAAVRYELIFPSARLIEWKFAREDWLFVVGILCRTADPLLEIELKGQRCLDTWVWL
jgi:hypothetical protein